MAGFGAAQGEPDQIDAVRGDDEGGTVGGPTVTATGVRAVVREDHRAGGGNRLQSRFVCVDEAVDGQAAVLTVQAVCAIEAIQAVGAVEAIETIRAVDSVEAVQTVRPIDAASSALCGTSARATA